MTAMIDDEARELDWAIYPGRGIVAKFRARKDGADWTWPEGLTAWLEVIDPDGCGSDRYDFTFNSPFMQVHIPRAIAEKIRDRSKFRVYLSFPGELEPMLWTVGKGVRKGW